MPTSDIPKQVIEIYSLMCRAALNKEYYGAKLHRYQTASIWMDILIAIGTTGSGVSALTVWDTHYGKLVWATLSIASTLLALAKPILQIGKTIERISKLFTGHSSNYIGLFVILSRYKRRGELTNEDLAAFEAAEVRFMELSSDDDPRPSYRLIGACDEIVRKRHPPEDFLVFPREHPAQFTPAAI